MHPVDSNFFGPNGISVIFNNGTAVVYGYILKQTATTTYRVTDGTVTVFAKLATSLSQVSALPAGYMTILIGGNHVSRLYSKTCDTLEGVTVKWSLGTATDGSTAIETASTFMNPTYAANSHGGLTTMAFTTAPAASEAPSATGIAVAVSTSPIAPISYVADLYFSSSATVKPTTGAVVGTYSAGDYSWSVTYPATAGTYYVWVVLSDDSYLISSAVTVT